MWKCVKCETNNSDTSGACAVCGMSLSESKKLEMNMAAEKLPVREITAPAAESETVSAADILRKPEIVTVSTAVKKESILKPDIRAAASFGTVPKAPTYAEKNTGTSVMGVVLVIIAVVLVLVIIAVAFGIFLML